MHAVDYRGSSPPAGASNSALPGQLAEIAVFLVPAPFQDSGQATAYLLAEVPPNQLVRQVLTSTPDVSGFCVPAVVRGMLRAE